MSSEHDHANELFKVESALEGLVGLTGEFDRSDLTITGYQMACILGLVKDKLTDIQENIFLDERLKDKIVLETIENKEDK